MRHQPLLSWILQTLAIFLPITTNGAGHNTHGQFQRESCRNRKPCNSSRPNKVIYVDGVHFTLPSAIAAANRMGETIVLIPFSQTVSTNLSVDGTGVELICLNDATLTAGASHFWMLTIKGVNDVVRDCALSPGLFPTSRALFANGATNTKIEGVTISGFRSGNGLIYIVGSKGAVIRNSRLVTGPGGPDAIFGEMNTTDAKIERNVVDESLGAPSAHAIGFHSTRPGQSVRGTTIQSNTILAGLNFCVEVGPFGGLTPSQVVVSHNTCGLAKNGGSGGYSLVVEDSTETDNSFDANGFTATIAAYEIVSSKNLTARGNIANIGQAWTSVRTSAAAINQSSRITFEDNVIKGWGGGNALGNSGFGLAVIAASVENAVVRDNLIDRNVFVFPNGQMTGGIFQQCDAKGSVCSDNRYTDNLFMGRGVRGSLAFRLENDAGTMANTFISGNTFADLQYGVYIWSSSITGTRICHNSNHTSIHVVDHGTATLLSDEQCPHDLR